MAFFFYIAIVLVSISGILLELDWLTKPKLEQPVPVAQNTARPLPVPQAPRDVAKAESPSPDLNPVYPKRVDQPKRETTGSAPATDTAANTNTSPPAPANAAPPPAANTPPAATAPVANAAPEAPPAPAPVANADAAPAAPAPQPVANTAPPANPAPAPVATANAAPAAQPVSTRTAAPMPAAPENPPPVGQSAVNAPKTCNVQACSASYQSFRAADCTYQPMQGERRVCTKRGNGTIARAPAPPPDRAAELRDVERTVRQLPVGDDRAELRPRSVRPADDDDDDYDAPRPPGRIFMMERRRWP